VVTYNRKELLRRCLLAISAQTQKPDLILVVDNASTDGTREMLEQVSMDSIPEIETLFLSENSGGAGGFSAGMEHAAAMGAGWVWIMDDDAVPHQDALAQLLEQATDPGNLYGSTAVSGNTLSWPMLPYQGRPEDAIYSSEQLMPAQDVVFIPFLGLLVSSVVIGRIGVPDAGFFIAADDVDYCFRARHAGAKIILVGGSRIEHPASERYRLWLPGRLFYSLRLSPWKRYYDVRNRLLVARNHHGMALYYSTVPGSFLRLFATLWHEPNRMMQLRAFFAGMVDGLLGRKGRRHEAWGIRQ
jgi:GT2 family glycosyltransferase